MHRLYRHHSSRRLRRHCPRRLLRARRPRRGPLLRKVGDLETTVKTQETSIRMLQDRLTRMSQSVVELTQSNAKRALPPMHEHLGTGPALSAKPAQAECTCLTCVHVPQRTRN